MKANEISEIFDVEQLELKGFSRSLAEIEWLLLILVLLYYVSPTAEITYHYGMVVSMGAFAAFVITFHYLNFFTMPARWKLAIETWVMILFLTWVLWNTGKIDSPLMNLYLLVIIASALTLGKIVTLLEFLLITAVYLYMGVPMYLENEFTVKDFSYFMANFAPFLLIAYVTTMLAADVQYGRKMFKTLSETDDITGLLNKRSFNSELIKEAENSIRHSRKFSLMLVDADNLKEVNDKYGHSAGDQLIIMLANIIKNCLRTDKSRSRTPDIVSRYGGDEFIAILPETDINLARETAERVRAAVENTSFDMNGSRVTSTVSIGLACYPEDANDVYDLITRADDALYTSKRGGRNRVSTASAGKPASGMDISS